jgi:nitrous oxidase accessory protein NosD
VNIYYVGNKGEVSQNTVFQALVFDGIDLVGDSNKANGNSIFNSGSEALYMQGNKNEANGNTINEAPVGVFVDSPSTDPHVNGNKFYNTATEVVTAPAMTASIALKGVLPAGAARGPVPAQP